MGNTLADMAMNKFNQHVALYRQLFREGKDVSGLAVMLANDMDEVARYCGDEANKKCHRIVNKIS